ncbi:MAG: NfeD family protein [Candidatus Hydrogenedentota bacterium]
MTPLLWVLLLYFAGLAMIIIEGFLPGGIMGIFGWLLVLGSASVGIYNYPEHTLLIILGEGAGAVLGAILAFVVLAKTRAARFLSLDTNLSEEEGYTNQKSELDLVGAHGEVYTALRPSGTILIGNRRIDAVSDGTFIDKGEAVRITEVHGNRVVVERTGVDVDTPPPDAGA